MTSQQPPAGRPFSSVGEYELSLFVTTCSASLKFPCLFSLTWKVDRQIVATLDQPEQASNLLTFNAQMQARVCLPESFTRAPKSTLCLNFFAPSRPHEPKLAGLVNLDLTKMKNGMPEREYKFERELDSKSWVRFAVGCKLLRRLEEDEVRQSLELVKLTQEVGAVSPDKHSVKSGEEGSVSRSIEKMLDQFFTPKSVKDKKSSPSVGSRDRSQDSSPNPQPQSSSPVDPSFITPKPIPVAISRPPPSSPSLIPKQDISQLLAKFESQHRLRQSLQVQLEKAKHENEALRERTEYINQRLQESERKVREVAESAKKQTTSQRTLVQQENKQLKEDLREMKYAYEQESAISASLQRELMQLNQVYEGEKRTNANLNGKIEELQQQLSISMSAEQSFRETPTNQSPQSIKEQPTSTIKLQNRLDKSETALREKSIYCMELEGEIEFLTKQILDLKGELGILKEDLARKEGGEEGNFIAGRETDIYQKVIAEKDRIIKELEEKWLNIEDIINEFTRKQEEIKMTFAIIQQQCYKLIEAVRSKPTQHPPTELISAQVPQDQPHRQFQPHTSSPITQSQLRHQHYYSVVDLQKSHIYLDEQQLLRMKSENESLREQTKQLQESLRDSRRTLWDFKEMIFKTGNHSQKTEVRKSERSMSRHRHHMRHIDRLKIEYTDKLRQMYNEIMHLNEIIYANSAKEKEIVVQMEAISEKYGFLEASNREMRRHLQQCHSTHIPTINSQLSTLQSQSQQLCLLKDTICHQQQQISNLKSQLQSQGPHISSSQDHDLQISRILAQKQQLQRRYGEMMSYIEELRAEHQKAQQLLIIKQAEVEELRDNKTSRRKRSRNSFAASPIDEGPSSLEDEEVVIAEALDDIALMLQRAVNNNEYIRDIQGEVRNILLTKYAHPAELEHGRSERLNILEKIREASIQFLRLKLDRIKSLQGSSELRKEFLKSVRPLQAKLDQLLAFGQGVLNTKVSSRQQIV